jgi:hypothetical protein
MMTRYRAKGRRLLAIACGGLTFVYLAITAGGCEQENTEPTISPEAGGVIIEGGTPSNPTEGGPTEHVVRRPNLRVWIKSMRELAAILRNRSAGSLMQARSLDRQRRIEHAATLPPQCAASQVAADRASSVVERMERCLRSASKVGVRADLTNEQHSAAPNATERARAAHTHTQSFSVDAGDRGVRGGRIAIKPRHNIVGMILRSAGRWIS